VRGRREQRDARCCEHLVKRRELFGLARGFFAHFSSMQKTLVKYGFLACATREHVNGPRHDLLRSTRSFDAAESLDDRCESAAKIFLDKFVESCLGGAVEDRNRANHPRPIRRTPPDTTVREAPSEQRNASSRSREGASAVASHRSSDPDAPSAS
jgi:hypothetical protein